MNLCVSPGPFVPNGLSPMAYTYTRLIESHQPKMDLTSTQLEVHRIPLPLTTRTMMNQFRILNTESDQLVGLPSTLHYPILEMVATNVICLPIVKVGSFEFQRQLIHFVTYTHESTIYSLLFRHSGKPRDRKFEQIAFLRGSHNRDHIECFTDQDTIDRFTAFASYEKFIAICWSINVFQAPKPEKMVRRPGLSTD